MLGRPKHLRVNDLDFLMQQQDSIELPTPSGSLASGLTDSYEEPRITLYPEANGYGSDRLSTGVIRMDDIGMATLPRQKSFFLKIPKETFRKCFLLFSYCILLSIGVAWTCLSIHSTYNAALGNLTKYANENASSEDKKLVLELKVELWESMILGLVLTVLAALGAAGSGKLNRPTLSFCFAGGIALMPFVLRTAIILLSKKSVIRSVVTNVYVESHETFCKNIDIFTDTVWYWYLACGLVALSGVFVALGIEILLFRMLCQPLLKNNLFALGRGASVRLSQGLAGRSTQVL